MREEEVDLFRAAVADVEPLGKSQHADFKRTQEPTPGQAYHRLAAQRPLPADENFLPTGFTPWIAPDEVLAYKRDGIQNGVFRKLRQGRYEIRAELDLHRLTVEQARREIHRFIRLCLRHDVRTVLINHGKGARDDPRRALIKSFVARWLPLFPEVMAFHSAQKQHGGVGALYVLLRKSERQKEINRRRLGLSR